MHMFLQANTMFRLTRQEQIFIVFVLSVAVLCSAAKVRWRSHYPVKIPPAPPELFHDFPRDSTTDPVEDHD